MPDEKALLNTPLDLLKILHRIEPLKHLLRTGWSERGVPQPESVAAHSWRLAIFALLAATSAGVDPNRAVRLALIHDLAEALTGDLTPLDGLGMSADARRAFSISPDAAAWPKAERRQQKVESERAALNLILNAVSPELSDVIREAWEDYELGISPEAQFVRQLDKLEAYLQGREYARDGRLREPETLNSFRIQNENALQEPALLEFLATLEQWSAQPVDRKRTDPGSIGS